MYDSVLMHYGVKRRSGRYPWGSGKEPYQRSGDLLARVNSLKKEGLTEKQIADTIGLSTTDLRMQLRVANHERRALEADRARSLRDDGLSLNEIAREMGYKNDSSIRSLLNENTAASKNRAKVTAETLKAEIEEKGFLDVGAGVELELGVSQQTLREALFILETEGYFVNGLGVPNPTNPKVQTTVVVAGPKNATYQQAYQARDEGNINSVTDYYSTDSGKTFKKTQYPASIDSKRVMINYGDQGGDSKDGVIEIRRGVEDLSLGNSHYAQVRILVDGTHYLKGMAIYSDDLPDGVDIRFNTNKKSGTPKMDVLKSIKDDPSNPFGAMIKANGQSYYIGKDGKEHLSAINKIKEQGDWDKMSKNLSSQFLSKQPVKLIKQQLDLTYKDYKDQYDEIMDLNNPTVKKKMLLDFADTCDGAAVHMKAAALPRQSTKVLLPVDGIKDNEVYAPAYRNGEQLALIRYPHGGTFEIPVVTVNNRNKKAISTLGKGLTDAIGISKKTADQLSGADFDGDQVVAIPTNNGRVKIKATHKLKGLEEFDPKVEYSTEGKKNVRLMTERYKQIQMGVVSNLITDMTLKGADEDELARAVRHSMVVIDAVKHKLDYRQSEKDNGIQELKERYQASTDPVTGRTTYGASTLLSRHKDTVEVPERRGSGRIDRETGEVVYNTSGRTYVDKKTGQTKQATTSVSAVLNTPDVRSMSSGTQQEEAYADYSNRMKALANTARKQYLATGNLKKNPSATQTYKEEVQSLQDKLETAARNAPKERRASVIANSVVKAQIDSNPDMTKDEIKKARQNAIEDARVQVGASGRGTKVNITDREWEAIQAGAISDSKLTQILRYADSDRVKELATPRNTTISQARISRIKAMSNAGFTASEIADRLGLSSSTVSKYLS